MLSFCFGINLRRNAKQRSLIATVRMMYNGFVPKQGTEYEKAKGINHMPTSDKQTSALRELQRENRRAEALSIRYILYRADTAKAAYYAIEIILNDESCMQILDTNEMRAYRWFEILVNEQVTPCTLSDILYDLRREEDERLHLQNLCKM